MAADLALNLPDGTGVQVSANMTNGKGQVKISIPGSQTPLLVHILGLFL